jgi:hypothetical protein
MVEQSLPDLADCANRRDRQAVAPGNRDIPHGQTCDPTVDNNPLTVSRPGSALRLDSICGFPAGESKGEDLSTMVGSSNARSTLGTLMDTTARSEQTE